MAAEVRMLRIQYQVFGLDGSLRNVTAVINPDSAAAWLSDTASRNTKFIILSVMYDERYD